MTASAGAADLARKSPAATVAVPSTHSWTGCYVGLNAGGGWAEKQWELVAFSADIGSHKPSGVIGGGQFGCDAQFNQWVVGIEAMFDGMNMSASHTFTNGTFRTTIDWLASATVRLGYAFGRTLVYAKGGAAWVHDKYDMTIGVTPIAASEIRAGWTIGGGVEHAFAPGWSAKLEFNYYDFGKLDPASCFFATLGVQPCVSGLFNIKQDLFNVLVGVNYRFQDGPLAAASAAAVGQPAYVWTGCYVGANAGGGSARTNWSSFAPFSLMGADDSPGFAGGGQAGCDYQSGRWVVGVEGMFDGASSDGSHPTAGGRTVTKVDWFSAATARVGVGIGRALLFAKGGAAWAHDKYTATFLATTVDASELRSGWTIGGGLEYGFAPSWSAKVEAGYYKFSTTRPTFCVSGAGACGQLFDINHEMFTILLGVNYRFRGGFPTFGARG